MDRRRFLRMTGAAGGTLLAGTGLYRTALTNGEDFDGEGGANGRPGPARGRDTPLGDPPGGPTPDGHRPDDDPEPTPTPSPASFPDRDGRLVAGIAPPTPDTAWLSRFEAWQGRRSAVVGLFMDVGVPPGDIDDFVDGALTAVWESGHVPLVVWQPFFGGRAATPETIAREVGAGRHDAIIGYWADALDRWLRPADRPHRRVYLDFAPEMNGDWLPWDAAEADPTGADYRAMWRRTHDVVMATGIDARHVQWIWAVNNGSRGDTSVPEYYPGDEYVDWAGIHGYNWDNWGGWRTPEEVFGGMVERVRRITDKPLAIPEYGCSSADGEGHDPERKAEWIGQVFEYFAETDVRLACWFNNDKETDWTVFGGSHGTTVHRDGLRTYNAYPAYRRAVAREFVLTAYPENPWVLTDAEFQGRT